MKESHFVLLDVIEFFDTQSGITVRFEKRENRAATHRVFLKYKTQDVTKDWLTTEGTPTVEDAHAMMLKHQAKLEEVFPYW